MTVAGGLNRAEKIQLKIGGMACSFCVASITKALGRMDGTPKRIIGKTGGGPGEFNAPGGAAVAPNGDLLVADFYNQRIQQLKADDGTVFAVDFGNNRIQKWRPASRAGQ